MNILDEYQQLRHANPGFDPVRPVIAANVRPPEGHADVPLISDPLTARVTDLFNVGYEILLQIFERFFAHTEETDAQLTILTDATIGLMFKVIKPLGDLITTLPVGQEHPGMTAGPSFELFYETDYLMPHREAAWALLAERLDEAAWLCAQLAAGRGKRIASQLQPVLAAMREIAQSLAAHLPADHAHARLASARPRLERAELDTLLGDARELAASVAGHAADAQAGELAGVFGTAYGIVTSAVSVPGCDPADQALIVPRLVNSVLRPLADVLTMTSPAATPATPREAGTSGATGWPAQPQTTGGNGPAAEAGTVGPVAQPGPEQIWDLAQAAARLRARLGQAGTCPAEVAEATAALQDLACRLATPVEAQRRRDELWQLQSGLPASIQLMRNGPYLVTDVPRLIDHLGAQHRPAPTLALCRCGVSAIKPLCDGSHASSGFSDAKDPERIPDRRDSYAGGPASTGQDSDLRQAAGFSAAEFGEQQRTRWIALLGTAADETALPSDPAFRSAFSSCVDWLSRAALTWVQPGAAGQPGLAPRWGWGPGGPPLHGADPAGNQAEAPDQPLPGPGEPVGFAAHIKPLFREHDRQSMSFAFDLWSYDDVRARGTDILAPAQQRLNALRRSLAGGQDRGFPALDQHRDAAMRPGVSAGVMGWRRGPAGRRLGRGAARRW